MDGWKHQWANHLDPVCPECSFGFAQHRDIGVWAIKYVLHSFSELLCEQIEIPRIKHYALWHRMVNGHKVVLILVIVTFRKVVENGFIELLQERREERLIRHEDESRALRGCWRSTNVIWGDH
jgi:hypothetical protein